MKIKKIILDNIRSYKYEEIEFPEGISLLSGDVGAGKSSVLLAIDFALFGARRGELSAAALLRKRTEKGAVTLIFTIEDKEIEIKRTLKKSSQGITQEAGYLSINGDKKELSHSELKQQILNLINYPQELLTKKSLIYRYTVYTPQEEMKSILLADKESRLETLRKVFNIDKYKRVQENAKIITTKLKENKKELKGKIYDLPEKKQELAKIREEIKSIQKQEAASKEKAKTITEQRIMQEEILKRKEEERKKYEEQKKHYELTRMQKNHKEQLKTTAEQRIKKIQEDIENILKNITEEEHESWKEKKEKTENTLQLLEQEQRLCMQERIKLEQEQQSSEDIKQKIANVNLCPICEQEVRQEHKQKIHQREEERKQKCEEQKQEIKKKEEQINQSIENIKKVLEVIKGKQTKIILNEHYKMQQQQKEQERKELRESKQELEKELQELEKKEQEFFNKVQQIKEESLEREKQELEKIREEERRTLIEESAKEREYILIKKNKEQLEKEVQEKESYKQQLDKDTEVQEFLEEVFIPLAETMERKVMLKVHYDFNTLFKEWFQILINTNLLQADLNEEFTPSVEQNGHDIEYENLSGGEKTAIALAYRLSLNQVINNMMSEINTKDVIILDEPTDGFSTEQLDKVREVLNQLKMQQIIIVSHEAKVESFVDNIIRIEKEGHTSKVINGRV